MPEVKTALLDLLKENPHNIENPFIFYSLQSDRPVHSKFILNGLKEVLKELKIDYKSRNISFHSWRHWFCSLLTQKIDGEKVAKVSGHLSENVFKKYSGHIEQKNIVEVGNAANLVFGKILPFKKAG